MKYKQLIIKTRIEDAFELQKYLFSLGYFWLDEQYQYRNKTIEKFKGEIGYIYIGIGKSCNLFIISDFNAVRENATDFHEYKITTYEQITRKQKLNKIERNESK